MHPALWAAIAAAALLVFCTALVRRRQCLRLKARPRNLPVRFTAHANLRMAERGITADEVRAVLAEPARHLRDAVNASVRLERDHEDRVLRVWVAEPWPTGGEVVVKTTAWQPAANVTIPVGRIGLLVGRGGATINRLQEETGARIDVDGDGTVRITGRQRWMVEAARRRVVEVAGPEVALARERHGSGPTGP